MEVLLVIMEDVLDQLKDPIYVFQFELVLVKDIDDLDDLRLEGFLVTH